MLYPISAAVYLRCCFRPSADHRLTSHHRAPWPPKLHHCHSQAIAALSFPAIYTGEQTVSHPFCILISAGGSLTFTLRAGPQSTVTTPRGWPDKHRCTIAGAVLTHTLIGELTVAAFFLRGHASSVCVILKLMCLPAPSAEAEASFAHRSLLPRNVTPPSHCHASVHARVTFVPTP
jgi:hypothetical protein